VAARSTSQTVTVTNAGNVGMWINQTALTGPNPHSFLITQNSCQLLTIQPGRSCTVQVAFTPTLSGTPQANLLVSTPATSVTVPLSGSSVTPAAGGTAAFTSGAITVPGARPGLAGPATQLLLRNSGSTSVPILAAYLEGSDAAMFRVVSTGCIGATLTPGAACAVSVSFAPGIAIGSGTAASARLTAVSAAGSASAQLSATVL
jgi:hypothetical protein